MKYLAALLSGLCLVVAIASGHALGEGYVFVTVKDSELEGRFEFSTRDLQERFGVSLDPTKPTIEQLQVSAPLLHQYIREHASFKIEGTAIPIVFTKIDLLGEGQTMWAQYHFVAETGQPVSVLTVRLALQFEYSRGHRNLLLVERNETTGQTYGEQYAFVFGPSNATQEVDLTRVPKMLGGRAMVREGVWHIWLGIDHVLFILAFLITTVLSWNRERAAWEPAESSSRALLNVLSIVTVFTLAHSVTLGLAALGYIWLPSRLVESAIALSIILVALGNVLGGKRRLSVAVIFGLGLFHGLGFASVLGHLPFRMMHALKNVLGFNIGVELGQIAIVAVVFPILFLARRHPLYPPLVIHGGSIALAVIAAVWFVQRAFALN